MIAKAQLLTIAKNHQLLPTTVQKDYVIGWLLKAISQHQVVSKWVFKGGTCLKKCYFETYRFSEDLDFTIPSGHKITTNSLKSSLQDIIGQIESNSGLTFPRRDWKIEEYQNPRGNLSYQVKISYLGPLKGAPNSLPRVKFDLTQDEIIADQPQLRPIHHPFPDRFPSNPQVLCYSVEEILAEKTRALVERHGRARDVYDVVNISRNFKNKINPGQVKKIAIKKFDFKKIAPPTVETIMAAIDSQVLKSNWKHQLAHQLTILPDVETYLDDLQNAIAWWLDPKTTSPTLSSIPTAQGKLVVPRAYSQTSWQTSPSNLDIIRQAARNRLCAVIRYHESTRLVEPYSLRHPSTGNEILHVWEIKKDGSYVGENRQYKTQKIESASISDQSFTPRWHVEL